MTGCDASLPKDMEEYGQSLILAFTLGMNCTFQAFALEHRDSRDILKVFNVAKDVANGQLYLGATGAEMRLKGLDVPANFENDAVKADQQLAILICHQFARLLFEGPNLSE